MSPANPSRPDQPPAGLSEAVLLDAYADGALSPEAAAWVEARLAERPDWRDRLERTRALMAALRTRLPPAPPALSDARLDDLLEAARTQGRSEPYERFIWPGRMFAAAAVIAIVGFLATSLYLPFYKVIEELGRSDPSAVRVAAIESDEQDPKGREEAVAATEHGGPGTIGLVSSVGGEGQTGAYHGDQLRPQDAMPAGKPALPGGGPDAARRWGDRIADRKSDDRAGQPVDRTDAPVTVEMKIEKESKQADSRLGDEQKNLRDASDKDRQQPLALGFTRATSMADAAPVATPAAPPAPAASPMPAKPMAGAAPAEPHSNAPAQRVTKGGTNDDGGAKKGKKPGLRGARGTVEERSQDDFAASKATAAESAWEAEAARSTISEARKDQGVKLREDLADGDLTKLLKERDLKPSDEAPALAYERSKDREQNEGLVGDSEAGAKQNLGARSSGGRRRSLASGDAGPAAPAPAFQRIDELAKSSGETQTGNSDLSRQAKREGDHTAPPGSVAELNRIMEEGKKKLRTHKDFEMTTELELGGADPNPYKLAIDRPFRIRCKIDNLAVAGGVSQPEVNVRASSGDEELVTLSRFTDRRDQFTNKIDVVLGTAIKGDGILQVQPGDLVLTSYSERFLATSGMQDPGTPTIFKVVIPPGYQSPIQRSPAAIANLLSAAASGDRSVDLDALLLSIDPALVQPFSAARAPSSASAVVPRGRVLVATARAIGGQVRLDAGQIVVGEPRAFDPLDTGGLDPEQFRAAFGTAPFIDTTRDYRHTVAITADTASFDRARNDLAKHRPVDPLGVQVEHFVNAVPFAWPVAAPGAAEAFTLSAEGGAVALGQTAEANEPAAERILVAVGLQANPALPEQRRALSLTVAVDASGSMARPGGIDRIRAGLLELQRQLKPDDRLAIVAFADQARVVLPSTAASDAGRIHAALAGIAPQGATNAADGLALAYQLASETATAEAVSRVVLATDGATLVGDIESTVRQVAGWRAKRIPLLIVGCGEERYEAAALDRLAQAGDGEHLFLGSDAEAIQVFRTRLLPERLSVLGRDAKLQVVWNPLRVAHARLVGFDTRRLRHQDFRDDSVQAGALAEASRVTALFEVRLANGAATGPLGAAHVRYLDTRRDTVRELICPLPGSLISSNASSRLRVAACAAQLGEILGATWWANAGALRAAPLVTELERIGRDIAVDGELGRFVGELRLMAEAATRAERTP
ncbi:hypothetical protein LBMAG53_01850 [Planctomycetota bacterium]|nr:hypothetical protein LBMAG53_01850 [Planctomycetota bacterium]